MTWKHICIIGLVCLPALNNLAFAAQRDWSPVNSNWCDPENWGGTVPAVGDRAIIEAGSVPYPVIGVSCYAECKSLEILPWGWQYAPPDCNVTINSGGLVCDVIRLGCSSTQYNGPGWTPTTASLVVNGGLVTLDGEVPVYDDNDPPVPPGGRGIWIGGGSTTFGTNWGHVIVNGGEVMTPKIAIYNGDVTLNGGLVYDTCDSPTEFVIRDMWERNKIYINGGMLGLDGDRRAELGAYIRTGRIIPYNTRGEFNGPNYMELAVYNVIDTNTMLSATYKPGCAWNPSPAKYAMGVQFIGGLNLIWSPGDWVATGGNNGHYVFLGTSFNDVNTAGIGTAGTASPVFIGRRDISVIGIAEANLVPNKTYYWRVDEVNDPCTHKGMIWEFTDLTDKATNPSPADGGGLKMPLELTWTAGDWSPNIHRVYIATDYGLCNAAGTNTTDGRYRGTVNSAVYPLTKLLDANAVHGIAAFGPLEPGATYYWRVDENSYFGGNAKGPVWSFNTGDSILIEDFQSYSTTEELNDVWLEGVPVCSGFAGTGRVTLIREGADYKYMRFTYDKSGGTGGLYFSEVAYPFSSPVDLTGGGVLALVPDTLAC